MSLRDRYNAFITRHEIAWELTFAGLAILFVGVGFAEPEDGATGSGISGNSSASVTPGS